MSVPDSDPASSSNSPSTPRRPRWIYPVIVAGVALLLWTALSEREYWQQAYRQKTLFPSSTQRKIILDEASTDGATSSTE